MRLTKNVLKISGIAFVILCSCSIEKKKEGFIVNANIQGISNGSKILLESTVSDFVDSTIIKDGIFKFSGTLSGNKPEKLMLITTDSVTNEFIYTFLLIGNETVSFNAHKDDLPWNVDVKGSDHQNVAEKFNKIQYQEQELIKQLKDIYIDSEDKALLNEKITHIKDSLKQRKVDLVKIYFNSYAGLDRFKYHKDAFTSDELSGLYNKLSPELQATPQGKAVKIQADFPAPEIGDAYYDYSAINQNDKTFALSSIKDKYILLHFSSTSCPYSQRSIPEQQELYKQFKDRLEIVKISQDIDKAAWKKSIDRDSITWISLFDGKGEYGDATIKYNSIGSPNFVLISPEKKVVEKWFGYGDGLIRDKIGKHLMK